MIEESGEVMRPWVLSVQAYEHSSSMSVLTAREPHCVGEVQSQQN